MRPIQQRRLSLLVQWLKFNQNLTQDFAKAIYNDTPELKTAEITGRKGDMQINPDGTKTMEVLNVGVGGVIGVAVGLLQYFGFIC
jgi:hypothetical protein